MYMFFIVFTLFSFSSFADTSLATAKKLINKDCDKAMTRVIISTVNENQMIFSCKNMKISVLFSMKDMKTHFVDKKTNKSFLEMTNVNSDKETPLDELQKVYALSQEHDEILSIKKFDSLNKKDSETVFKRILGQ